MNHRILSRLLLLAASFCLLFNSVSRADETTDAIVQAAMRYVFQNAGVNDPAVTVEEVAEGFARVKVRSLSGATDPATAFLKASGKGQWTVVTLGTGITPEDLRELGIPASLFN